MRRPWPMRFVLNLIKLAAVLSRCQEGQCFSCSRMFNISQSRAKIPRSFCSQTCEHLFIREHLKLLTLTDCARLLLRIETLLTPLEGKIYHKTSGR
jgi:hypothetical protein